jgi:hypothetical protein
VSFNGFGPTTGPSGEAGSAGATGATGPQGDPGDDGAAGQTGRFTVPLTHVFDSTPETITGAFDTFYRVDMSGAIGGDTLTLNLPQVTAGDVGKLVGLSEIANSEFGGVSGISLVVQPFAGQSIDGASPYQMSDAAPRHVFLACQTSASPDVYGWTFQSKA